MRGRGLEEGGWGWRGGGYCKEGGAISGVWTTSLCRSGVVIGMGSGRDVPFASFPASHFPALSSLDCGVSSSDATTLASSSSLRVS